MKMFNHLKHLTLNKVYLKTSNVHVLVNKKHSQPRTISLESHRNHSKSHKIPGKLETSPGNKFGEKDTLNAYLLTPQTYPFFLLILAFLTP